MTNTQGTWFAQLGRQQMAMLRLDPHASVSALTRRGLTLLLLLVLAGLIDLLPGVGITLGSRLTIAVLLKLGVAATALVILLSVFRQGACVLGHVARGLFPPPPGGDEDDAAIALLAWGAMLLLADLLGYWIVMRGLGPLVEQLALRHWPLTAVEVAALLLALVAGVALFKGSSPLFGRVGDAVAHHVVPPPEDGAAAPEPPQAKCPSCGVLHESGSRFCSFCGQALKKG